MIEPRVFCYPCSLGALTNQWHRYAAAPARQMCNSQTQMLAPRHAIRRFHHTISIPPLILHEKCSPSPHHLNLRCPSFKHSPLGYARSKVCCWLFGLPVSPLKAIVQRDLPDPARIPKKLLHNARFLGNTRRQTNMEEDMVDMPLLPFIYCKIRLRSYL